MFDILSFSVISTSALITHATDKHLSDYWNRHFPQEQIRNVIKLKHYNINIKEMKIGIPYFIKKMSNIFNEKCY